MAARTEHFLGPDEVNLLRARIMLRLPPRRAEVLVALLANDGDFEPPARPITYEEVAQGLGVARSTVREHVRRSGKREPGLLAEVQAVRGHRMRHWHEEVAARRRERSRRWGKRRWAARYRAEHGEWPWLDAGHIGSKRSGVPLRSARTCPPNAADRARAFSAGSREMSHRGGHCWSGTPFN